jgi:hypothetical protein
MPNSGAKRLKLDPFAKGVHPYRKACRSRGMKVAAPPLDSPCDRPVTYAGDSKTLIKSSIGISGPTLSVTTRGRDGGTNYILRIKEQDKKPKPS